MLTKRHIIVIIVLVVLIKVDNLQPVYGQGDSVEIINQTFLGNWQRNYYGNG